MNILECLCCNDLKTVVSNAIPVSEDSSIPEVIQCGLCMVSPHLREDLLVGCDHQYFSLLLEMMRTFPAMIGRLNPDDVLVVADNFYYGLHQVHISLELLAEYYIGCRYRGQSEPGLDWDHYKSFIRRLLPKLMSSFFHSVDSWEAAISGADALVHLIVCELDFFKLWCGQYTEGECPPATKQSLENVLAALVGSDVRKWLLTDDNLKIFSENWKKALPEIRGLCSVL